jgi:rhodanese-related sulfurtransferase
MVENIPPRQTWEALQSNPDARLVDVRTDAEWNFVGIPDLTAVAQEPVLIAWQIYPSMQVNVSFTDHLRRAGVEPRHHVYFICRSGARSLAAARAALSAGFRYVYNVADGFEGPLDNHGRRGVESGWKAEGLPWRQK